MNYLLQNFLSQSFFRKSLRKPILRGAIACSALVCGVFMQQAAVAETAHQDPYAVVQQTTEKVLAVIKDAKGDYQKNPQPYNEQVTVLLEEVIDFDRFARSVMGSYASAQKYQSLKLETEKAAFNQRIKTFSTTFKRGIVDTYAKSLFDFNGDNIKTLPPRKGDDLASGAVTVMQKIYNSAGKPYVIQYSMRRAKNGEWKLNNLIVEGINLGLTYRNQFATSADSFQGDIDKVIANWHVVPAATILKKEAEEKKGTDN